MGNSSRTMFSEYDRILILKSLRSQLMLLTADKEDLHAWIEAQHAYRLADAIAHPRKGVRSHKLAGYTWYFEKDSSTPLGEMDAWIKKAQAALAASQQAKPRDTDPSLLSRSLD